MCGFYVNVRSNAFRTDSDYVDGIIGTLYERGPDAAGVYTSKNILMLHTLLSLTGPISTGMQPVVNDQFVMVFNGEIFNYRRLATDYLGYSSVQDVPDTEILFKLLCRYGEKIIDLIDGQFAIVFWDLKNSNGFVARDFFGQKPLYYRENENGIEFCSLVKTLHYTDPKFRDIDTKQIASIGKNFVCNPGETVFSDIKEIAPGTIYRIVPRLNGFKLVHSMNLWKNFWKEEYRQEYSQEEFDYLFLEANAAIKSDRHTPSIFFSGGLDSTAVASIYKKNNDIKLYSLALPGDHSNEFKKQKSLSKNLDLSLVSIEVNVEDYVDRLRSAFDNVSTLSTRLGFVGMYHLCEGLKKDGKRLAYTGEGADEILFGYDIFYENMLIDNVHKLDFEAFSDRYKRVNSFSRGEGNELFAKLAYSSYQKRSGLSTFQNTKDSRNGLTNLLINLFGLDKVSISDSDAKWENYLSFKTGDAVLSRINKTRVGEVYGLLQHLLVSQGDHMSAGNSIETRTPFLNKDFVEFCRSINPDLFFEDWFNEKQFLKHNVSNKVILDQIGQKFPYRGLDPMTLLRFFSVNDADFNSYNNSQLFSDASAAHLPIRPDKSAAASMLISHYVLSSILSERRTPEWRSQMVKLRSKKYKMSDANLVEGLLYYEKK